MLLAARQGEILPWPMARFSGAMDASSTFTIGPTQRLGAVAWREPLIVLRNRCGHETGGGSAAL